MSHSAVLLRVAVVFLLIVNHTHAKWKDCAEEGEFCNISDVRMVRFGGYREWVELRVSSPGIKCNINSFGSDPFVNKAKTCQVSDTVEHLAPIRITSNFGYISTIDRNFRCKYTTKKNALIGILMPASKFERRKLIRETYLRHKPADIDVFFVCCLPRSSVNERAFLLEIEEYNDIIVMNCEENLNNGKTYDWFKYVYSTFCPYKFVMKCDDDTFVHLPKLRNDLVKQHNNNVYYGRRCTPDYPPMCGALYGLSWNLIEFIATNDTIYKKKDGQEDYATYQWMMFYGRAIFISKALDEFHDHPWATWTGWNRPYSLASIAIHQCKEDERLRDAFMYFFHESTSLTISKKGEDFLSTVDTAFKRNFFLEEEDVDDDDNNNHNTENEKQLSQKVVFKGIRESCLFLRMRESYLCPNSTISEKEWKKKSKKKGESRVKDSYWTCDKGLEVDLRPWIDAHKTKREDLSISVYSGDNIIFSRALASRDTWMQKFRNTSFIVSLHGNPVVPVIPMKTLYPHWFKDGTDPVENLQLFAYKEQLKRHPNAKWFYTIGDDTYIHPDYILTFLDEIIPSNMTVSEYTKTPRWMTFCRTAYDMPPGFNISRYNKTWLPEYRAKNQFSWCSGAVGWFLSRPAVQMFTDELELFLENLYADSTPSTWRNHHACDVTSGLLLTLLGIRPEMIPRNTKWPGLFRSEGIDNEYAQLSRTERPHYHYLYPTSMLAVDHRVTHEKIDRIINSGKIEALISYFREFVDEHYDTLRKKMVEIRYVHEKCKEIPNQNWGDIQ
jgi:hypothetical protein